MTRDYVFKQCSAKDTYYIVSVATDKIGGLVRRTEGGWQAIGRKTDDPKFTEKKANEAADKLWKEIS